MTSICPELCHHCRGKLSGAYRRIEDKAWCSKTCAVLSGVQIIKRKKPQADPRKSESLLTRFSHAQKVNKLF